MTPISETLGQTQLFSALDRDTLERLATEVRSVHLLGGEQLFRQGDIGDCLYVVAQGRLRAVVEQPDGSERRLGEAGRGDVMGEMALVTGEPRSATVYAVRDSELLRLGGEAFNRLVEQSPAMMMQLTRRMVLRYYNAIKTQNAGARNIPTTIAIVPTSAGVPLQAFADRLERALAGHGPVLRLTSERVDSALGAGTAQTPQDHSRSTALAEWLVEQEVAHSAVMYVADAGRSSWTSRCLRQADCVLVVGADKERPEPGPVEVSIEREGLAARVQKELVLLHTERRSLYPGTKAWLAPRRVDRHHHVALDSDADVERLVRILRGTATGLVFGGGGARCFCQIGVLRAMREAGVAIDMVGGTSLGAYMAAQVAFGWDPDRMIEFNTALWVKQKPLKEYTLPYVCLVSGNTVVRVTRALYGDANLEDLALPYFCCSTNISRASVVVHDRGPIWRYLGASMAVPGISPPLFEGGDLLVDGAVLDNLPIGVMRERCNGTVIAVDVSPVEDVQCDPTFAMCPPSWQIFRNRMNPFAREKWKVPTIFEVLSRCASLSSVQQVEQLKQRADLYLHPPVDTFSMFDWHRIVELADAGYGYTAEKLGEWAIARAGAAKAPAVPPPEATGPAPLIPGVRG